MTARKTERLLNLIFLLLATRTYLTKTQIRAAIGPYRDATSDAAFERMFERDKEELRELGIAVEVGSHERVFGDNEGYRIARDTAELADIDLTGQEAAVIGLATTVWRNGRLAAGSSAALLKLRSVGVEVDTAMLGVAEPRLSTAEPAFDAVWDAATLRIPVQFDYASPGQDIATRRLQPWGIVSWRDRWYVVGYDLDRQAARIFRLSRIRGPVDRTGSAGSFEVPPGTDIKGIAGNFVGPLSSEPAIIRVRRDRCHSLRRTASSQRRIDEEFDEIVVPHRPADEIVSEITSYGPDAVAISPAEVRDRVIEKLQFAAQSTLRPLVGEPR